jgi:hypothetical protein
MRKFILAAAIGAMLAACGGSADHPQAAATTTTSTTLADPAASACREHVNAIDLATKRVTVALDDLTLSRDGRIAMAAREVETIVQDRELDDDAIAPGLDLDYANAELELTRACKTAGYL